MPEVYLHYFGTESSTSLLEANGIIQKDKAKKNLLTPISCPNCGESNKPKERFCISCKLVLKYESYSEVIKSQSEREDEINTIKQRFSAMESQIQVLISSIGTLNQSSKNELAKKMFEAGMYRQF